MTKWMKSNGLRLVTGIGFAALFLAAAWGVSRSQIGDLRNLTIPALQTADKELSAADKEQSKAITNAEKDILGVRASMDKNTESIDRNTESINVLASQQKEFHDKEDGYREKRDLKLAKILAAVEKGNASR